MRIISSLYSANKPLTVLGLLNLSLALLFGVLAIFNQEIITGLNSMIKPMKFSLSIGIYGITMAVLLRYVTNQRFVWKYSVTAFIVMMYEQFVIIFQAFRGQLSHFNRENALGIVLYAFMGIAITLITLYTLYLAVIFIRQKTYSISPAFALSIKIGLIIFVVFSFFGWTLSAFNQHSYGGLDGGPGLPVLNWSTQHGDLRVGHFFGMHALQVIPIFGYLISKKSSIKHAKTYIWLFSAAYFLFVLFTVWQALSGKPFIEV